VQSCYNSPRHPTVFQEARQLPRPLRPQHSGPPQAQHEHKTDRAQNRHSPADARAAILPSGHDHRMGRDSAYRRVGTCRGRPPGDPPLPLDGQDPGAQIQAKALDAAWVRAFPLTEAEAVLTGDVIHQPIQECQVQP